MIITNAAELNTRFMKGKQPLSDQIFSSQLGEFFQTPGIVEIYGPSGTGKSTLTMQYVVALLMHNRTQRAVYICTDNQFSIARLSDMCSNNYTESEFLDIIDRIIVQHLGDAETQEHFICYFLEPLITEHRVSVVVIDSISANFRTEPRTHRVTTSLYLMAHKLNSIASVHRVNILSINQVTDNFIDKDESVPTTPYRPTLGLSWSNCVTARLEITRTGEFHKSGRLLKIIRCPSSKPLQFECALERSGFKFIS